MCLLRPQLEYVCSVWNNCNSPDALSLERLQLSLAHFVLCLHLLCSVSNMPKSSVLKSLGWPTFAWRRCRAKLLLLWTLKVLPLLQKGCPRLHVVALTIGVTLFRCKSPFVLPLLICPSLCRLPVYFGTLFLCLCLLSNL